MAVVVTDWRNGAAQYIAQVCYGLFVHYALPGFGVYWHFLQIRLLSTVVVLAWMHCTRDAVLNFNDEALHGSQEESAEQRSCRHQLEAARYSVTLFSIIQASPFVQLTVGIPSGICQIPLCGVFVHLFSSGVCFCCANCRWHHIYQGMNGRARLVCLKIGVFQAAVNFAYMILINFFRVALQHMTNVC